MSFKKKVKSKDIWILLRIRQATRGDSPQTVKHRIAGPLVIE